MGVWRLCFKGYGLNEKGIPSKKGGKWYAGAINGIIKNEKYTGDVIFQKIFTDSHFIRHTNNGKENRYLCENHHEPIISHEAFEKANMVMEQRGKEKGNGERTERYQNRYELSGRIKCGECGASFKRRRHYKPSGEYVAWCCTRHLENTHSCSMKYIKDEQVKAAFVTMMNKMIFAHQIILKPLLRSMQGFVDKDRLLQIKDCDDRLEKNMERRQVLTSLMASGLLEPALFNSESNALTVEEEKTWKKRNKSLVRLVVTELR